MKPRAPATPEQKCEKARHDAAAKSAQCQTKAIGIFHGGGTTAKLEDTLSKCRVKYTATWLTLQKMAAGTGSTCDAQRFVDNGNGTVTDNLTGLDWEKKTKFRPCRAGRLVIAPSMSIAKTKQQAAD